MFVTQQGRTLVSSLTLARFNTALNTDCRVSGYEIGRPDTEINVAPAHVVEWWESTFDPQSVPIPMR